MPVPAKVIFSCTCLFPFLCHHFNEQCLWTFSYHIMSQVLLREETESYLLCYCFSLLSHVWLFVTPWTAECQAPLSSTISRSLLKFMSIDWVMLSNHLVLCHPLFSFCLQSSPASRSSPMNQLFTSGSQSIGASASVLPMNIRVDFL